MSRLFISRVEIEGFRGINRPVSLEFEKPVVLLYGDNFTGKSSILGSIEWCLFGELKFIEYESKKHEEIVNDFHPLKEARVKVFLKDQETGEEFIFTRSRKKDSTKMDFVAEDTKNKEKYEGKNAEKFRFSLLRKNLEDFLRTNFLHQEAVGSVLTEKATERSKGMDRLLGLEDFRNVLEIIGRGIREVNKKMDSLGKKQNELSGKIETAQEILAGEIEKLKKDAEKEGIKEADINLEFCFRTKEIIKNNLLKLDKEITERNFPNIESFSDFEKKIPSIKKCITKCQNKIIQPFKFDELESKRRALSDFNSKVEDILRQETELQKQYDKLKQNYGNREKVENRLNEVNTLIESVEENFRSIDLELKIINDVIRYLPILKEEKCPICDRPLSKDELKITLEGRRKKLEKKQPEKIQELSEKESKYKEEILRLKEVLSEFEKIEKDLSLLKSRENALLKEINQKFGCEYKEFREATNFIKRELNTIEKELRKVKRPLQEKMKGLEELNKKLDSIKFVIRILRMKERKKELEKKYSKEKKEIISISAQIKNLSNLQRELETISDILTRYQKDLAENLLRKAQTKISKFYTSLVKHPYYDTILIEMKQEIRRGIPRNNYYITAFNKKDERHSSVTSRFSKGGINCVALSLFLSLATELPSTLSHIIMDSPIQELDTNHKRNLAQCINDLLKDRRFIIATSDGEFKEFLSRIVGPNLQLIILSKWNTDGPVF